MTKKRKKRIPPEVREALIRMVESIFVDLMQGILKATTVEEEYASLEIVIRHQTQESIRKIARCAGEKYVDLASPDPGSASKTQMDAWKKQAIEYALRKYAT